MSNLIIKVMKNRCLLHFFALAVLSLSISQAAAQKYWNKDTRLIPWRPPMSDLYKLNYEDLDNDGDPDVLHMTINDSIPVIWIDDDDDMVSGDLEGDTDNDCFCADINRDGYFGGPLDLCVDWIDIDNDGIAEMQAVVVNGGTELRGYFDWSADIMYIIDYGEKDRIKNYIDWNGLVLRAWEHKGHAGFFTDYHGNNLFIKMHGSTFRITDPSYSWENPFIFFDHDNDNLTEMAIRLVDTPLFRSDTAVKKNSEFAAVNPDYDVMFKKSIDYAAVTWDLDNDNGQGNEFDYDMSIKFSGPGFDYSDQLHKFKNMRGLPDADKYFYDARWRQTDELVFPDQKVAYDKVFREGEWDYCWFVFDEDDDCNRWERVEFYEPRHLWKIGANNGGLDNNPQADASGDRGEFDMDNSGEGNLYIAPFDGRLHLFGAEWGAWRIDIKASNFQGFGGLYPSARTLHERDQQEPEKWATIRYSDSDSNGFFDLIEYDLDGDTIFEEKASLIDLGIDDRAQVILTAGTDYRKMSRIFRKTTCNIWKNAGRALKTAQKMDINTDWYAFWQQPRTLNEKYQYGFWLSFYLYRDMCHKAMINGNTDLKKKLDMAYYSGNWRKLRFDDEDLKPRKRINFVFILLDDQPYDAFSHSGRYPFLKTPNLDKLASEGVRFNNFFCTTSLCSPSRASYLTGTYAHKHGVTQNDHRVDPDWESNPPFTVALQDAGYETAMVGKIHMKLAEGKAHVRPGFDYWLSFQGQGEYFNPELNENGREFTEEGYMTDILTRYAIDWLTNRRNPSKPFSLFLWHKAVHEPFIPAERYAGVYKNENLPEPPFGTARETFLGKPEWQRIKAFDSKWKEYTPVESLPVKEWNPKNRMYLSLLECLLAVDESTGEVINALEAIGELDNTVIIYASDNGYFMGEHTYWDKRIAYEPSMRIPLIMRFPGIMEPGKQVEQLCMNIDIAPTILNLAGVEIPEYMQGKSLLPLLENNGQTEWRSSFLFEYYVDDAYPYAGPDLLAVRTDSFKLVDAFLDKDIDELYNLTLDPGEMKNLISDPEYKNVEVRLRRELERLKEQYGYNPDRDWWLRRTIEGSPALK